MLDCIKFTHVNNAAKYSNSFACNTSESSRLACRKYPDIRLWEYQGKSILPEAAMNLNNSTTVCAFVMGDEITADFEFLKKL